MERCAIFFDIDGTLWDYSGVMPPSVPEVFARLKENGHLTFLCSGRSMSNITDPRLKELPLTGIVAACGNDILAEGKSLYQNLLSWEQVALAQQVLHEEHMPVVFEGPDFHWMNTEDFEDDPYVDRLWADLGDRAKRLHLLREGDLVSKFSADITKSTDFERVQRLLADHFDVLNHNGIVVEFIPKGSSKATGIEKVCAHYDIPREAVYAVGDSVNDLDMLRYAQYGICMGNGTDVAKAAADYVTDPIHEDGILHAMEHFGLI